MISGNSLQEEMTGLQDNFLSVGKVLSESKWSNICNVGSMDNVSKYGLAVMLENLSRYMNNMDEATRAVNIGDFQKYAFPLVRAIFPELIANSLVSVQPMLGPASLVFYMDFVFATNKGSVRRGDTMMSSVTRGPNQLSYTSPQVDSEPLVTGDGSTVSWTNQSLLFTPIVPGSLSITDGVQTLTDDGQGNLVGNTGSGTNTINYSTGALNFSFSGAPDSGSVVAGTWTYDMEANPLVPEVDLQLNSSPVIARPRKLRAKWSLEAAYNMRSLHGLEAEVELTSVIGSEIRFEIDREIINDLQNHAAAGSVFWNKDLPQGVSLAEQKLSMVDCLQTGCNVIHQKTGRATGTWLLCGESVATIVETLPGFIATPGLPNGMVKGAYRAGNLNGKWEIFKDPFYTNNYFLMGFKGQRFLEAGYIYAPYIPLYSTPTIVLDDFVARKGLATQYGKKAVNPLFYLTGQMGTGAQLEAKAGVAAGTISSSGQARLTHGDAEADLGFSTGRGVFGV
jgi:hypothetical protein